MRLSYKVFTLFTTVLLTVSFITQFSFAPRQAFAVFSDISALPDLYKRVTPSVVRIDTAALNSSGGIVGQGIGSGFVYNKEIITNFHVVNGSQAILVTFVDGNTYVANVIGTDPYSDLAVLHLASSALSKENVTSVTLGDSASLQPGQQIFAVGNPLGWTASIAYGMITGQTGRGYGGFGTTPFPFAMPDMVQYSAPTTHGNSGGPIFNFAGEVIGVVDLEEFLKQQSTYLIPYYDPQTNSTVYSPPQPQPVAGIRYAIPSDTVKREIPQLISAGTYKHPYTGLVARDLNPITAMLTYRFNEARGAVVKYVVPEGPGGLAGVNIGDVIYGIDNKVVVNVNSILNYIETKSIGDTVVFNVWRNGGTLNIPVKLAERPPLSLVNATQPLSLFS